MKYKEMRDTRCSLSSFRLHSIYVGPQRTFALAYTIYRQRLSKTRNKSRKLEVEDDNAISTAL